MVDDLPTRLENYQHTALRLGSCQEKRPILHRSILLAVPWHLTCTLRNQKGALWRQVSVPGAPGRF
jgi:hypothetical protein